MAITSALGEAELRLYDIAESQAGYFTTAQAIQAGYTQRQLSFHVHTGRFQRVRWGIYRLALFPASAYEDFSVALLQTGPASVISHDSALALYGLSDALPVRVHVTVPRGASTRRPLLQLHTGDVSPRDVTSFMGLRVTTIQRTIADVTKTGMASELVIQAVQDAVRQGMVTPADLIEDARSRGGRTFRLVRSALEDVAT